jgi:hypothetical protein
MEKKFVEGQKGDDITPFDGSLLIIQILAETLSYFLILPNVFFRVIGNLSVLKLAV